MRTPWILETLDELENLERRCALGREMMFDEQLAFENRINALSHIALS